MRRTFEIGVGLSAGAAFALAGIFHKLTVAVVLCVAIGVLGVFLVAFDLGRGKGERDAKGESKVPRPRREPKAKPVVAPLGFVEYEEALNGAGARLNQTMELLGKEAVAQTGRMAPIVAQWVKVAGGPSNDRRRVLRRMGGVIAVHAKILKGLEKDFRESVDLFIEMATAMTGFITPEDDKSVMLAGASQLHKGMSETKAAHTEYLEAVKTQRAQRLSQATNGAYDDLLKVLEKIIEDSGRLVDFCESIPNLVATTIEPESPSI